MRRTLALLATTMLTLGAPALADETLDVVAQFEIQSFEPSPAWAWP